MRGWGRTDNKAVAVYRQMYPLAVLSAAACAAVVFIWMAALPEPVPEPSREGARRMRDILLLLGYFAVAAPIAARRTWRLYKPLVQVYEKQRPAGLHEQQVLLRLPTAHALHNLGHWTVAAVFFTAVSVASGSSRLFAVRMFIAIVLSGLSSSAVIYLLIEWGHRPLVPDFLQGQPLQRPVVLGVSQRLLVSWTLGSGVCLLAVLTAPLDLGDLDRAAAVPVMMTAAALGIVGGAALVWVTARSVAGRLRVVSQALRQVEQGDLDVSVVVDDGGEVGQLQGSLNYMVSGLRDLTAANAQLTAEVRAQLQDVRASRARIVTAGDEARRRVERDLHDGAQQRLVALGITLHMVKTQAQQLGDPNLTNAIEAARRELQESLRELRELAAGLHPTLLTEASLAEAVREAAARCSIPTTVTETPDTRLPALLEVAAYYTVKEGLTNAVKHSAADHIRISVLLHGDDLVVGVIDNGIGGAVLGQGSGLIGLHDRVSSFGGTLTVHSPPGHGTVVWAKFPMSAEASTVTDQDRTAPLLAASSRLSNRASKGRASNGPPSDG